MYQSNQQAPVSTVNVLQTQLQDYSPSLYAQASYPEKQSLQKLSTYLPDYQETQQTTYNNPGRQVMSQNEMQAQINNQQTLQQVLGQLQQQEQAKNNWNRPRVDDMIRRDSTLSAPQGQLTKSNGVAVGNGNGRAGFTPLYGSQLQDATVQAYNDILKQTPITAFDPKCCPNPPLCGENVLWKGTFKGCPTTFATDPSMSVEVAPLGDRYWVADLNPLMYERSIIMGAEWDPYQHMRARQGWAQFLSADLRRNTDKYTQPLNNIDDTFAAKFKTQGPPAFTLF